MTSLTVTSLAVLVRCRDRDLDDQPLRPGPISSSSLFHAVTAARRLIGFLNFTPGICRRLQGSSRLSDLEVLRYALVV